ncbi:MAG: DUF2975 domain-containing protein [Solirubrobacteraceae bacterium]
MLTREKRSLSVLKLVLDGVWWLSIAAIALVGALLVLLVAHAIHSGAISVGSYLQLQPSTYQLTAHQLGGSSAEIRNVSAALAFRRPRAAFVLVGGAILAVAGAWLLTVLHQLRQLVGSAQKGEMFAPANAGRIQRIGIAVIGFELVRSVAEWAGSMYLKDNVSARGLSLRSHLAVNIPVLLVGLLLLVLAAAFRLGTQLQIDHDLTI